MFLYALVLVALAALATLDSPAPYRAPLVGWEFPASEATQDAPGRDWRRARPLAVVRSGTVRVLVYQDARGAWRDSAGRFAEKPAGRLTVAFRA